MCEEANQKDFVSGLMFMIVGVGFSIGSTEYNLGNAARMGPGYFPMQLGVLLAILGGVLIIKSLGGSEHPEGRLGRWALKPMFFIIGSNLLFGALLGGLPVIGLPAMGMVVAIFALTLVACLAGSEFVLKEALILSVILAAASYLLFVC